MVSVIVPIYNVEQFLSKCIESIIVQTYTLLEIILVDDGSTDNSLQICEFYREKDTRIKIISQKNQGQSVARNVGIEQSKGEYLMFVDSDDWIHPRIIEILLKNIQVSKASMAIGGVLNTDVYICGGQVQEDFELLSMDEAMEYMLLKRGGSVWGRIFQRKLFDGLRFPYRSMNEDYAMSILLLERCPFVAVNNSILYYYYKRENSCCTSAFSEKNFDTFWVGVDIWEHVVAKRLSCEELVRAKLSQTIIGLCSECCRDKNKYDLYGYYFKQIRKYVIDNFMLLITNERLGHKYKFILLFLYCGRFPYTCLLRGVGLWKNLLGE